MVTGKHPYVIALFVVWLAMTLHYYVELMNSMAVVTKTDLIVVTLVPFLLLQRSPFLFHFDVFTRTVPIWTLTSGWLLPYGHCSLSSRTRSLFLQSPALY